MARELETLWRNRAGFLGDAPGDNDVALSTRIRLARNLTRFPFPIAADAGQLEEVRQQVRAAVAAASALGEAHFSLALEQLTPEEQELLFERRLVSRELLTRETGAGLELAADETLAIMVNEEDHLRLQALRPGFRLEEAYRELSALDDQLGSILEFAFHPRLGFLTCCPTNVGTGLRASVMLHLPGLVLSQQIKQVVAAIDKLNLAVRGAFGEGTDNRGNLFQISNQSTLGESEQQILERLSSVIATLIAKEIESREELLRLRKYELLDRVGRAFGLLRYSYRLTREEALTALSAVRLGVDLGMFRQLDLRLVNELFLAIQPAHLTRCAGVAVDPPERDVVRAGLIRERLKKITGA